MRQLFARAWRLSILRADSLLLAVAMLGVTAYVCAESETGESPAQYSGRDTEDAGTSAAEVWLFTDSSMFFLQLTHVTRTGDYVLSGTSVSSGVAIPTVVRTNIRGGEFTYESLDDGVGLFQTKDGGSGLIIRTNETRMTLLAVGEDLPFLALETWGLSEQIVVGLAASLLSTALNDCEALASAVCGGPDQVCWLDESEDCTFTCRGDPGCHDDSGRSDATSTASHAGSRDAPVRDP